MYILCRLKLSCFLMRSVCEAFYLSLFLGMQCTILLTSAKTIVLSEVNGEWANTDWHLLMLKLWSEGAAQDSS